MTEINTNAEATERAKNRQKRRKKNNEKAKASEKYTF